MRRTTRARSMRLSNGRHPVLRERRNTIGAEGLGPTLCVLSMRYATPRTRHSFIATPVLHFIFFDTGSISLKEVSGDRKSHRSQTFRLNDSN